MSGRLLIIELAAPEEGASGNNWSGNDLLMMLLFNGRERTAAELGDILRAAGFKLARIMRTSSPFWIIEAVPV